MKGVGHVDDVRAVDELGEFGRPDAVAALFRVHHRRLVGLAALLVDDRATAEDVVQDAFAGLRRRSWRLRDPHAAAAYLTRAVVNGGRDRLRRGRRATAGRLRTAPRPEGLATAERDAPGNDKAGRLWGALTHLPPRQRQVLVLRHYLGQSETEVAETLHVSRGSVRKHASQGLEALARDLGGPVMSTYDLGRRLGELLHRRAEDAMNDTNTEEQLGRMQDDTGRSTQRRRRTWIAGGLVAAAAAAALIVWRPDLGSDKADPDPAHREQRAERTAAAFVEAYAEFDPDTAATYLADDAALTIWTDELGNDHWRRGSHVLRAFGTRIQLDKCDALWSAGPATYVSCAFDLQGLGSDQLGRGPYPDNTFSLTVNDGKIVDASMAMATRTNGFYNEMWKPFARWVSRTYPADARVMYYQYPKLDFASETPRSLALWRQHVNDYVEAKAPPSS